MSFPYQNRNTLSFLEVLLNFDNSIRQHMLLKYIMTECLKRKSSRLISFRKCLSSALVNYDGESL